MAINEEWHKQHATPRGTLEQKIRWHQEHMAACNCSPPPGAILVELERRERRGKKKPPPRR